jgi:hypothetical protein
MKKMIFLICIIVCLIIGLIRVGAQTPRGNALVIIDAGVPSSSTLIKEMKRFSKVVFLEQTADPLRAILEVLKAHAPVSSLHLFSEGRQGNLFFSGKALNAIALEQSADVLGEWQSSFAYGGDILLYGCEVAKGDTGVDFVRTLAVFTGLDVAASDNHTGSSRLGGDWFLEIRSGRIETDIVVSNKIIDRYSEILSAPVQPNSKSARFR